MKPIGDLAPTGAGQNDCGDCLAFDPDGTGPDGGAVGRCRRYAPVPLSGEDQGWPRVRGDDWCLEHRQTVEPYGLTFILEGAAAAREAGPA